MKESARSLAFDILHKIYNGGAYSNLLLDGRLTASQLDTRDKAFVSSLVYGTIDRTVTIDYQLAALLKRPLKKLEPKVITCLRMGVYQILFMDKVPGSAAVNESVRLARQKGCAYASGLVNAVLRRCLEKGKVLPERGDKSYLSVAYSAPEWLCDMWCEQYGRENTEKILQSSLEASPVVLRVNTLKTTVEGLLSSLRHEGVNARQGMLENSVELGSAAGIDCLECYKRGLFHVQDYSSQLCCLGAGVRPGLRVYDMCAAPGGKSFTLCQLMGGQGEIFSFDLHEHRVGLIKKGAVRLGLESIRAQCGDAGVFDCSKDAADVVLCDVPCSGLGVISRKPEIKLRASADFSSLVDAQRKILSASSRYVKPGGTLIYSTCTLNKAENEENTAWFLSQGGDFSLKSEKTYMPHIDGCNGFYAAQLERNG